MRNYLLVYFVINVIALSSGKDDLDSLIDEVFRPQRENNPATEAEEETRSQDHSSAECTCVPYYLCDNGNINTDGAGIIDIRVKQDRCENYLDVCCQKPLDDTNKITPAPTVRKGCGIRNPEGVGFRITGNEDGEAQFGEFPWMVAVLHEEVDQDKTLNVYQCGGALIHPEVIVTSAHCVSNKQKTYKIRAGEWDTQTNKELLPHQDALVKEIVIHPEFHSGSLRNDIALLFLESPLTLAENIDTICLPRQEDYFDHARCFVSGWGKDVFEKEGKYQAILKKVELPLVPRQKCESALRKTRLGANFILHKSFVCAGGEPGRDACKGDGGSPLVCPLPNDRNKFVQVGIVAWGIGCGEHGTPGVYANVAGFRHWIDQQLHYHQMDTEHYEY